MPFIPPSFNYLYSPSKHPAAAEGFLESRPVKEEKILTTSQALNLLKLRGYVIKDDPLPTS